MKFWRVSVVVLGLCATSCQDFGATPPVVPTEATNPDARVSLTVEHPSYSVMDTIRVFVRNEDAAPLYAWFQCQGSEKWADGAWVDQGVFCWYPFRDPPWRDELAGAQLRTLTRVCPQPGVYRATFVCYDVPADGSPRTYFSRSWTVR